MISERPGDEGGQKRNSYICPEEGCDLIPEVLSAHSDIGRIVLRCSKGHINELNVEKYFQILDEKKDIIPKDDGYNIHNIDISNAFDYSRKYLMDKQKDIFDVISFNLSILKEQEKNPNNFYCYENLINIKKSIIKENCSLVTEKLSFKTDDIIEKYIKGDKVKEEEMYAIETLGRDFGIYLKDCFLKNDLHLKLKGNSKFISLRDKGFRLISQIRFRNLIELNLANNEIIDITPLNNMLLPHLEIINFSDNKIEEISPIANLLSKSLSEIYIQNNKIKSLGPFLNSNFRFLEIFRVDGNPNAIKHSSFNNVLKKFENIVIIYTIKRWDEFINNYFEAPDPQLNINDYINLQKLELGGLEAGDIFLYDLYPLINYPNQIKYLILDNNKLRNVSLLNKMPLYNMEYLDLSSNLLTNIKFLKKMCKICKQLKFLFLNNNNIHNIFPLFEISDDGGISISFFYLQTLTLKNNSIDIKDKETFKLLEFIINQKLNFDYDKKDLKKSCINDDNNNEDDDNSLTGE